MTGRLVLVLKCFSGAVLCIAAWFCTSIFIGGCTKTAPLGAIVLTQTPLFAAANAAARDVMDLQYPPGSRVVLAWPPFKPENIHVLSKGLIAAGDPQVSPDGQKVYFIGKTDFQNQWQIFENEIRGSHPRPVTCASNGAMSPALLMDGGLIFASPVPSSGASVKQEQSSSLYVQYERKAPKRLTFGPSEALHPSILSNGRILFLSKQQRNGVGSVLYTMKSDGSDIKPIVFSVTNLQSFYTRPKEYAPNLIGFLVGRSERPDGVKHPESVPLESPAERLVHLLPNEKMDCRSLEPGNEGKVLMALETWPAGNRPLRQSFGIYEASVSNTGVTTAVFDDPAWDDVEAVPVMPFVRIVAKNRYNKGLKPSG